MKIDIIDTIIKTQFSSYFTNRNILTLKIGTDTRAYNIENQFIKTLWYLKNENDVVIQKGMVDVKLNFFETSITLENLKLNKIYVLCIQNSGYKNMLNCIICTSQNIKIIDENYEFNNSTVEFGNVTVSEFTKKALFSKNWKLSENFGNGLIKDIHTGEIYAYVPSVVYVPYVNNFEQNFYNYTPFDSLKEYQIPIRIIPHIKRIFNDYYTITPPSKIKITFSNPSEKTNIVVINEPISSYNLNTDKKYVNVIFEVVY